MPKTHSLRLISFPLVHTFECNWEMNLLEM